MAQLMFQAIKQTYIKSKCEMLPPFRTANESVLKGLFLRRVSISLISERLMLIVGDIMREICGVGVVIG